MMRILFSFVNNTFLNGVNNQGGFNCVNILFTMVIRYFYCKRDLEEERIAAH